MEAFWHPSEPPNNLPHQLHGACIHGRLQASKELLHKKGRSRAVQCVRRGRHSNFLPRTLLWAGQRERKVGAGWGKRAPAQEAMLTETRFASLICSSDIFTTSKPSAAGALLLGCGCGPPELKKRETPCRRRDALVLAQNELGCAAHRREATQAAAMAMIGSDTPFARATGSCTSGTECNRE